MIKKIVTLFVQPLKFFASRNFAEKVSVYFSKNKFMLYAASLIITLVIVFLYYILPELKW
jgi:hypothetical protein